MHSPPLTLRLLCNLLTSHGKLYSVFLISLTHVRETSLVKVLNTFFPPYVCLIYCGRSEQLLSFVLLSRLTHDLEPYIKFLYVRPDVCLRLPSDSLSRRTPLSSAEHFPLLGRDRDLHPLEWHHARRTQKGETVRNRLPLSFIFKNIRISISCNCSSMHSLAPIHTMYW